MITTSGEQHLVQSYLFLRKGIGIIGKIILESPGVLCNIKGSQYHRLC